jgi:hypothetical protein
VYVKILEACVEVCFFVFEKWKKFLTFRNWAGKFLLRFQEDRVVQPGDNRLRRAIWMLLIILLIKFIDNILARLLVIPLIFLLFRNLISLTMVDNREIISSFLFDPNYLFHRIIIPLVDIKD